MLKPLIPILALLILAVAVETSLFTAVAAFLLRKSIKDQPDFGGLEHKNTKVETLENEKFDIGYTFFWSPAHKRVKDINEQLYSEYNLCNPSSD